MRFDIGFDRRDIPRLYEFWNQIFETSQWSEGYFTELFEEKWSELNELPATAFSSWWGGALAAMKFFELEGKTVLCPSNTFMATPLAITRVGGEVRFVDCNREDLCMSYEDFVRKAEIYDPSAAWVVHIGGHIAFEIEEIATYCKDNDIVLLEDCAHAHGSSWNGKKPGCWGDAGVYSFYATKTISTGEGGILVSRHEGLREFSKKFRNYGKPDFGIQGGNFRMSEFTAAIGAVQCDRLSDIVNFKNEYAQKLDEVYDNRVRIPEGMVSGYYKYIVFDPIDGSTGKVYEKQCHTRFGTNERLPNSEWVAENHWCVPIYYSPR